MPIAIDDLTAGLLDAHFEVTETEAGLWLTGERSLAGTRTLLGKATPFVGRDRQTSMLEQLFSESVEERSAQVVLLTGPAGVGKSRLAHEFLGRLRQRGEDVAIWMARADSPRAGSAFGLLAQALRSACGIREGEPLEARRAKLRAKVAERVAASEQARVTEFLGEIIATPPSDEESPLLRAARHDVLWMGEQRRRAWEDFVAAESAARPVLLVIEDLQWGDLPTVRSIDGALLRARDQPFVVLAMARPDVHDLFPSLWADRRRLDIRLGELTRRASERLVRHVLGDGPSPETVERLVTLADGNAFYLEELIRATAERRDQALPETVLAMVQSRIEALDPAARRVLRAASAFGEIFWQGGVAALLDTEGHRTWVEACLGQLVEREVVVRREESRFPGEPEFAFRHALLREGAYAMLTEQDRALAHKLAGAWLERHGEADPVVLAEHFDKGGEHAAAAPHWLRAAEAAHYGNDVAAAAARVERGLGAAVPLDVELALRGMRCELNAWRVDTAITELPNAEALIGLATPGSLPWAQALSARLVGRLGMGSPEGFTETMDALLSVQPTPEAVGRVSFATWVGVFASCAMGAIGFGEVLVERALALLGPEQEREPLVGSYLGLMGAFRQLYAQEDPWGALPHFDSVRVFSVRAGLARGVSGLRLPTAVTLWALGAAERAEEELRGVTGRDEEYGGFCSFRPFILAQCLGARGEFEEAQRVVEGLVSSGRARGVPPDEARGLWALAEVRLRAGDPAEADRLLGPALAMLERASPLDYPGALATLAALRLTQGRPADALAAASLGVARTEAMGGACSFFFRGATLRLVHVESLEATGEPDAARAALAAARRRLLADAAKIGDPTARKRFLEAVPENARTLALALERLGHTE